MKDARKMKIFVIGCGSIGERHVKNLISLGCKDITALDTDKGRLRHMTDTYGVSSEPSSRLPELLRRYDYKISIVCTPNHLHIPIALLCAERNSHIFIEKPLSHTNKGILKLERIIEREKLISMVACNMRFYPSLKYIKKCLKEKKVGRIFFVRAEYGYHLPYWRPSKDYRKNYGARKEEGGGVLLDLYHEFDFLYWFFGMPEKIMCMSKKTSNLEIDVEDNAEAIMEFGTDSAFLCSLHVDYIQYRNTRSLKIVGERGSIFWERDLFGVVIRDTKGEVKKEFYYKGYDANAMYVEEMEYFLDCVSRRRLPETYIKEAKKIQSIILKAKDSQDKERLVKI